MSLAIVEHLDVIEHFLLCFIMRTVGFPPDTLFLQVADTGRFWLRDDYRLIWQASHAA